MTTDPELLSWAASRVFSTATLRLTMHGNTDNDASAALRRLAAVGFVPSGTAFSTAVDLLGSWLARNYRNEYIYKNAIANKILLGRHSLRTTTMLTEFRVARSIADCVVINGSANAYEIKTELDSPSRLASQIDDYKRAFAKVTVVTHHSLASRYATLLEGSNVGLLSLSARGHLSPLRTANLDETRLEVSAMMKSLRKSEYSEILRAHYGFVPDVPNTLYFRECLRLSDAIPAAEYQDLFLEQLRSRRVREPGLIKSKSLASIRSLCLQLNPEKKQLENVLTWLDERVD